MDVHSAERVPPRHLPQLAARIQCGADHVHTVDGRYRGWQPLKVVTALNIPHWRSDEEWICPALSDLSFGIHGHDPIDTSPSAVEARNVALPEHLARLSAEIHIVTILRGKFSSSQGFETAQDALKPTGDKTNLWWKHGDPWPYLSGSQTGLRLV